MPRGCSALAAVLVAFVLGSGRYAAAWPAIEWPWQSKHAGGGADDAAGRPYLVVAAVGDASQHERCARERAAAAARHPPTRRPHKRTHPCSWLAGPGAPTWDLILTYYGAAPGGVACPQCIEVTSARGAKWDLLHALTSRADWPALAARYRAIMLPDDDILMDTPTINAAFNLTMAWGLRLSQPSLCK